MTQWYTITLHKRGNPETFKNVFSHELHIKEGNVISITIKHSSSRNIGNFTNSTRILNYVYEISIKKEFRSVAFQHFDTEHFSASVRAQRTTDIRTAAQQIGISPSTLSRIENGKQPDVETFAKICKWMHIEPNTYLNTEA